MIEIKVSFFGAFRKYAHGQELQLNLLEPVSIQELKKAIADKLLGFYPELNQIPLLEHSVFAKSVLAQDDEILNYKDILNNNCVISVLPPVCGG